MRPEWPTGATEQVWPVPASASPGQDSHFEPPIAIRQVAHPSEGRADAPALMSRHLAKCPARQIKVGITGMSMRLRSNEFPCRWRHVSLSVLCVPRRSARNRQRDLLRVGWTAIGGQHLGTPQNLDALEESRVVVSVRRTSLADLKNLTPDAAASRVRIHMTKSQSLRTPEMAPSHGSCSTRWTWRLKDGPCCPPAIRP